MTDISASLRELSQPSDRGEKIKDIIARAAKRAGLKYSRAFEIWYGRARSVSDSERVRVAEALEKKRKEAAHNELHDLRLRLARLESLWVQSDPTFHRPVIDMARENLGALNGKRRP